MGGAHISRRTYEELPADRRRFGAREAFEGIIAAAHGSIRPRRGA